MKLTVSPSKTKAASPLSPYVHLAPNGAPWQETPRAELTPPMPGPQLDGSYTVWTLSHRGQSIYFCSPEEMQHAIDVLSQRILTGSRKLGERYGAVNSHWLSRLHKSWKPWKIRQQLVEALQRGVEAELKQAK